MKGKVEEVVDPKVYRYNSDTGAGEVQYKWIFLAKSHVKKKTMETVMVPSPAAGGKGKCGDGGSDGVSYGCLLCSVEGNATGIYGNVDTLMKHILEHGKEGMSDKTKVMGRCIVGRVARNDEAWDVNIVCGQ